MKIAMIEDDSTISFAVSTFMKRYNVEVVVFDSLEATKQIDLKDYNLIILDANLPDGSGFDYLKWLREFSGIPVIMLTVKNEDEYVLKGFENGADEYITKPFSPKILVARVEAVLRRTIGESEEKLVAGAIEIDKVARSVYIDQKPVDLSFKEYELLTYFIENKGIALSREKILSSVWNYDYFGDARTIDTHVKKLRAKMGERGDYIKTVWGMGYKFEVTS